MSDKKKETPLELLIKETGLDRNELIDRALVGIFSEGAFPSRGDLLGGSWSEQEEVAEPTAGAKAST